MVSSTPFLLLSALLLLLSPTPAHNLPKSTKPLQSLTLRRSSQCHTARVETNIACLCYISYQHRQIRRSQTITCRHIFRRAPHRLGRYCNHYRRNRRITYRRVYNAVAEICDRCVVRKRGRVRGIGGRRRILHYLSVLPGFVCGSRGLLRNAGRRKVRPSSSPSVTPSVTPSNVVRMPHFARFGADLKTARLLHYNRMQVPDGDGDRI